MIVEEDTDWMTVIAEVIVTIIVVTTMFIHVIVRNGSNYDLHS